MDYSIPVSGLTGTPNVPAKDTVQNGSIVLRGDSGEIRGNIFYGTGLRSSGHLYLHAVSQSGDFTVNETVGGNNGFAHLVTTGASARTATLEAAANITDKLQVFVKADSGVGSVIVNPNASETVAGTLVHAAYNQYDRVLTLCDGSNHYVLIEPTVFFRSVAASTAITAGAEGTFDTSGQSILANTLRVGDILEIEAQVIITSTTGSETTNIKLKLGTTVIVATGALDVANNDIAHIRATIQIRTIGASGTMVAAGVASIGTGGASSAIGALTAKPFFLASTTLDTTADLAVNCTCTHSSTGESARLDLFTVKRFRN